MVRFGVAVRFVASAIFLVFGGGALAAPVTWTLSGVTFADGGTATGSFVYDADTDAISNWAISVAGGNTGVFPPVSYSTSSSDAFVDSDGAGDFGNVFLLNGSNRSLRLPVVTPMTNAGGTLAVNAGSGSGGECFNCAPYRSLSGGNLIGVGLIPQTITNFIASPASPVFAPGGTFGISAAGGASGNPVTFASTTAAVCTVGGSTVTMLGGGLCTLTANQAGNASYLAAPQVTLNVTIGAATQTITNFIATPANPVFAPGGTFGISAAGGASGNPVTFASTTAAVCTVGGSTVTMLGGGLCTLTANQAGNASYLAAPQVTLNVTIGAATQTITNFIATPANPVFAPGGSFGISATGGASGNPVAFASTTAGVCTVVGSTVTMLGAGTCTLTADQAGNANYSAAAQVILNVTIGQASQVITNFVATPANPVFAPGGSFGISATGGASGNPVAFASTTAGVCTVVGSTVTMLGAGTCTLSADQAGNANYSAAAQVIVNVTIGQASQVITNFVAVPANPVFAPGGSFGISATGGASGNPVAFASTTAAVCTVGGSTVTMLSGGTCTLTADQAGNTDYSAAPQVVLDVLIAADGQTISFGATPDISLNLLAVTVEATASSGLPVTLTSLTPAVCEASGTGPFTVGLLAVGACTLEAVQAGDASYLPVSATVSFSVLAPYVEPLAIPALSEWALLALAALFAWTGVSALRRRWHA